MGPETKRPKTRPGSARDVSFVSREDHKKCRPSIIRPRTSLFEPLVCWMMKRRFRPESKCLDGGRATAVSRLRPIPKARTMSLSARPSVFRASRRPCFRLWNLARGPLGLIPRKKQAPQEAENREVPSHSPWATGPFPHNMRKGPWPLRESQYPPAASDAILVGHLLDDPLRWRRNEAVQYYAGGADVTARGEEIRSSTTTPNRPDPTDLEVYPYLVRCASITSC